MSITLVNGSVLFPTRPNWRESVTWKRSWQTEIAAALQGQEDRRALRRIPRVALTWLLTTLSAEETATVETWIQAALKSGLACTGYWGRACEISVDVTSTSAELYPGSWPWAAGDYILFVDPVTHAFDAILVDSVAGNTLTLHAAVSQTYKACGLCWPIVFGKLKTDPLAPFTSDKADIKLTLLNALPSPASVPEAGDWCGHCNPALEPIGLQYVCTPLLPPTALEVNSTACSSSPITVNCLTPTLSWTAPTGAAGYLVEIFSGSCGGTLIHTSPTQTDPNYTVPGGVLDFNTTYYWRVTATPSSGYCEGEASPCCTMATACPTITLSGTYPGGAVGTPYSSNAVTASGGASPYTYGQTSGTLPPGLTLATNGTLAGTPTTCGDYTFTVTATDANGCVGTPLSRTVHISLISFPADAAANTPSFESPVSRPARAALVSQPYVSGAPTIGISGNGSYAFDSFSPGSPCDWIMVLSNGTYAWVVTVEYDGAFYVDVSSPEGDITGLVAAPGITCDCGTLSGSVTIPHTGGAITVTIS